MTSGGQGHAVTVICGINAAGQYIPLIYLFARKKIGNTLMECCSYTINGLLHLLCACSGCNIHEHNKTIHGLRVKILHRHHSHKTLEAMNGAHAPGITLITLPPHISHVHMTNAPLLFNTYLSKY